MLIKNATIVIQLDVQTMSSDELSFIAAQLATLELGYEKIGLEVPAWLKDKQREVKLSLDIALRASREAELRKLQARRAALATPEEKRKALEAEIVALEAQLK